jgi:hypothetical protein
MGIFTPASNTSSSEIPRGQQVSTHLPIKERQVAHAWLGLIAPFKLLIRRIDASIHVVHKYDSSRQWKGAAGKLRSPSENWHAAHA